MMSRSDGINVVTEAELSASLGAMMRVLSSSGYGTISINAALHQLIVPVRLRQYTLLTDNRNQPAAFATWAFFQHASENQIKADPYCLLHPSQWNEGSRAWIVHLYAKDLRYVRPLGSKIISAMPVDAKTINWVRQKKDGRTVCRSLIFK